MIIRKILVILLCAAVIVTAAPTVPIYAEDSQSPEVYVQSASAVQGSSVEIRVGIRNASQLAGIDVSLYYDSEAFTVDSATKGSFISNASASINTGTAGIVRESIVAMDGLDGNGDLMTVRFNVGVGAVPGDYDLRIGIREAFDTSLNNVSVSKQVGKITVKKNELVVKDASFCLHTDPSEAVSEGDEVHFVVNASYTNGLAAGTFEFEYDPKVLEYVNASLGSELVSDTAIYSINSKNAGIIKITYAEIEAITSQDGAEFFDITFRVKQKTATTTNVSFSGSSLLDADLNTMTSNRTSSDISIAGKKSSLYADWDGKTDSNRQFTVDIVLTGDSNVGAGDFRINFDTEKLNCEIVTTDASVAADGAYLVTKEDTSGGTISFSYLNADGCSEDSTLLHITFRQLHGISGKTELILNGKDVVDKNLNDIEIIYPKKEITLPFDEGHAPVKDAAVSPSCTEDGLTEGSHCSICNEVLIAQEKVDALGHHMIKHDAVAATCEKEGSNAYYSCDRCNDYYSSDAEGRNEIEKNSWIIPGGHKLMHLEAEAATCQKTGNVEYWQCSECSKYFADAAGKTETTLAEVTTPEADHIYGELIAEVAATCTDDGVAAHYECSECHKKFVKNGDKYIEKTDVELKIAGGHKYGDLVAAVPGTCDADGVAAHYECSECHKKFVKNGGEYVEKTDAELKIAGGHKYGELVAAVPATCDADGTKAHYECFVCHKKFVKNGDEYVEKTDAELKIEGGHKYGEMVAAVPATCDADGTKAHYECSECHKKFVKDGDKYVEITDAELKIEGGHKYGDLVAAVPATCDADGTKAHYECSECHKKFVKDGNEYVEKTDAELKIPAHHTYDQRVVDDEYLVTPATCISPAVYHMSCICGEAGTDTFEDGNPDVNAHNWDKGYTVDVPATCIREGVESRHCAYCDAKIDERSIAKTEHNWSAWTTTTVATEDGPGESARTCSVCGDKQAQEIAQLPPSLKVAVKIQKPKAANGSVMVKWKKASKKNQKKIAGYQIQVATDSNFTNIVKRINAGKKSSSKKVKGLAKKTKYYVRVRTYKGTQRGKWSTIKSANTK